MSKRALCGADIFDGEILHHKKVLLLDGEICAGIVSQHEIPKDFEIKVLNQGTLMPGFVDLQVNGGGGVMFNDQTSVEGLETIANAHASTGTRAFLPTLITDTSSQTRAAVDAVEAAIEQSVPGVIGIHLEGPHLSIARKGAHDPSLIRPMEDKDENFLIEASRRLPNVMVTVAPENVSNKQIERLADAGIIVSLGHTDCTTAQANDAITAGASCVTHLFNAMSQMSNREPGLVGAALDAAQVSAGLIADNIHVHAASMRVALASKRAPGSIFLVTDAMSTVGSEIKEFQLNGRRVLRQKNRLTLEDGTLAGADLDMPTAIAVLINEVGTKAEQAYAMATSAPARLLRSSFGFGKFNAGEPHQAIHLNQFCADLI